MCYVMYEWIPLTLDRFVEVYPHSVNRAFGVFVIHTLVRVYAALWAASGGTGLDIACDNVRAIKNNNGQLFIKVYPP